MPHLPDFDPASRRFSPAGAASIRRFSWELADAGGSVAGRLAAHGRAIRQANRANAQQVQFQEVTGDVGESPFPEEAD